MRLEIAGYFLFSNIEIWAESDRIDQYQLRFV